jgi:6-phosphogluconate dehydrogenase
MIGLGKMGANMSRKLARAGHQVIGTTLDFQDALAIQEAEKNFTAVRSIDDLREALTPPRIAWSMVPAGKATTSVITALMALFEPGDIVIDGGNSNYKSTVHRAEMLGEKQIHFVDVGTSGGIWGLKEGYSMMVGGEKAIVEKLRPIFEALAPAPDRGWGYVGPNGAGHFVKMVHNGIEYGMMQSYAEGFDILRAKKVFEIDLHRVAEIWRYGSVIRSWLLDLTAAALAEDQELKDVKDWVADSGEGRWTIQEAIDLDIPAPVITLSLMMRFISRQDESYAAKLLATMRNQFGGHMIVHEP